MLLLLRRVPGGERLHPRQPAGGELAHRIVVPGAERRRRMRQHRHAAAAGDQPDDLRRLGQGHGNIIRPAAGDPVQAEFYRPLFLPPILVEQRIAVVAPIGEHRRAVAYRHRLRAVRQHPGLLQVKTRRPEARDLLVHIFPATLLHRPAPLLHRRVAEIEEIPQHMQPFPLVAGRELARRDHLDPQLPAPELRLLHRRHRIVVGHRDRPQPALLRQPHHRPRRQLPVAARRRVDVQINSHGLNLLCVFLRLIIAHHFFLPVGVRISLPGDEVTVSIGIAPPAGHQFRHKGQHRRRSRRPTLRRQTRRPQPHRRQHVRKRPC